MQVYHVLHVGACYFSCGGQRCLRSGHIFLHLASAPLTIDLAISILQAINERSVVSEQRPCMVS